LGPTPRQDQPPTLPPNVRAEGAPAREARRVPNSVAVGRSPRARGWAATNCLAGTSRPDTHEHRPTTLPRPGTGPAARRRRTRELFPLKRRTSGEMLHRASQDVRAKSTTPRAGPARADKGEQAPRFDESARSGGMPVTLAALSCRTPPPSPWWRHPDKTSRRSCRPTPRITRRRDA